MSEKPHIIIRGPLGVGKSTVAKLLADYLKVYYISVDKVLENNHLAGKDGIPMENFLTANIIIEKEVKENENGAVIDGNFYHKEQLDDLIERIDKDTIVFTLKATVGTCIERDKGRTKPYGEDSARFVHMMTSRFDAGFVINTEDQTVHETLEEIINRI